MLLLNAVEVTGKRIWSLSNKAVSIIGRYAERFFCSSTQLLVNKLGAR